MKIGSDKEEMKKTEKGSERKDGMKEMAMGKLKKERAEEGKKVDGEIRLEWREDG